MSRTCIYCREVKPPEAFDREHVLPQAFGTFTRDNLVLDCVCRDCNGLFGRTIDQKLARDTVEGLERYRQGLRSPAEFRGEGC